MAQFAFRRYNDVDVTDIENVLTFCVEENNSGMKLSLDRVLGKTAALTDIGRSSAQRIGLIGIHPMEKIGSICTLNRVGLSLKKRTPSYIWANRRIWKYPII